MNGRELERLMGQIEINVGTTQTAIRKEILEYLSNNQDSVLAELRASEHVSIPTSAGTIELELGSLREAVA